MTYVTIFCINLCRYLCQNSEGEIRRAMVEADKVEVMVALPGQLFFNTQIPTGLGHVTVADLKRLHVVKPNALVLQKWNEIVDPLIERAFIVEQQAQTLATLRDILLPRQCQ